MRYFPGVAYVIRTTSSTCISRCSLRAFRGLQLARKPMFRRDSAMRSPSGLPVRPGSDVARRSPVVPPPHHSWPERSVPKDSGRDPARGGGRFRVPRTSLCADRIGFRGGSGGSGRCRRAKHLRNCTYERCDRYAMPSPLGENLPMPGTLSSESESSLAGMSACRHVGTAR